MKIEFLEYKIDNLSMNETLDYIEDAIDNHRHIIREDLNAAKIVWMKKDPNYAKLIMNADLINADGQSVVIASKWLGSPIKERVSGVDLMENLVSLAYKKNYKIFFFGAKEEIVQTVVKNYSKKYSSSIIAGYRNGYFSKDDEATIAGEIKKSGANIVFIGISSPLKEQFVHQYKNRMGSNLLMGVGGSFDVVSGNISRAPLWMQKAGLEWFYRFLQEPRRMWKRYLYTNSMFLWLVLTEKLLKSNSKTK